MWCFMDTCYPHVCHVSEAMWKLTHVIHMSVATWKLTHVIHVFSTCLRPSGNWHLLPMWNSHISFMWKNTPLFHMFTTCFIGVKIHVVTDTWFPCEIHVFLTRGFEHQFSICQTRVMFAGVNILLVILSTNPKNCKFLGNLQI